MRRFDLDLLYRAIAEAPLHRRGGKLRSAGGLLSCSLDAALGVLSPDDFDRVLKEIEMDEE